MYFVTYLEEGSEKIGVLSKDQNYIINLKAAIGQECPETMLEFIEYCSIEVLEKVKKAVENSHRETLTNVEDVKICAPIPKPKRNVICLGLNYRDHASELKGSSITKEVKEPQHPVYFGKMAHHIIGTGDEINSHLGVTEEIDYEVELAVVIAKDGLNIPVDEAEDYIFGYTVLNDITARDLQKKHVQWIRGKSLDTFTAMGPYLVHKSDIPFPVELNLSCRVNGEIRQSSNTNNLIFDIPYIISDLSKGMTLKAGDIIATGTPSGVGMGFKPPKYLKSGDVVECAIEKIGTLINKVK